MTSTSSPAEQERALLNDAGWLWLERDVLGVSGPDALSYLQGQVSQDVEAVVTGATAWTFVLQPQGKVDAFARVTRDSDSSFVIDVDAGFGDALIARLARFKLRVKCEIEPLDWRCLAVRGPRAGIVGKPDALIADATWPGLAGWDALGEAASVPEGVIECSAESFETVRVRAGIPRLGRELDEKTIPAESGLVDRAVSFTKGCYTGQELVARIDSRGHVNRHLRRLVADEAFPPGAAVLSAEKQVGSITSAATSALDGRTYGLGYVRREVAPPAAVTLEWEGTTSTAEVTA